MLVTATVAKPIGVAALANFATLNALLATLAVFGVFLNCATNGFCLPNPVVVYPALVKILALPGLLKFETAPFVASLAFAAVAVNLDFTLDNIFFVVFIGDPSAVKTLPAPTLVFFIMSLPISVAVFALGIV